MLALPETRLHSQTPFPLAPSGDPAAPWKGSIAQIVLGKCDHDRHHLRQIREWLARL